MAGMVEGERVGWQAQVMQLCMHMQTPRGILSPFDARWAVDLGVGIKTQISDQFTRQITAIRVGLWHRSVIIGKLPTTVVHEKYKI